MKRADNKSDCPVNVALEAFGDSWSLLIIRDIIFWGKKTYKEFLDSEEHMATNVLAARLLQLEQKGILAKKFVTPNVRRPSYELTSKGLDLIPIVLEMSAWSLRHGPSATAHKYFMKRVYADRERMLMLVRNVVQRGGAIFSGPNSVLDKIESQVVR